MEAKTRVVVAEDSSTIRHYICDVLSGDPTIEVIADADNGKTAIELCERLRPDVMTLDMMMPLMSGLAATEYIMAHCPTPILIVSASTNRGELFKTYEALAAGAVDVLEKPSGIDPDGDWERRLRSTVKLVSRIRVITHPRAKLGFNGVTRSAPADARHAPRTGEIKAVTIGASTGGPAAVLQLLRALPNNLPIPILLVVHIGAPFDSALADWLDGETHQRVRFAMHGEPLAGLGGNVVAIAPAEKHLAIAGGRLVLTEAAPRHSCRPSVDVLFESAARELADQCVGCLLTGMGQDGAAGLLAMRKAGAFTIAQDEASCVVFGMPREAVKLGAAERVLNIPEMARELACLAEKTRKA